MCRDLSLVVCVEACQNCACGGVFLSCVCTAVSLVVCGGVCLFKFWVEGCPSVVSEGVCRVMSSVDCVCVCL